MRLRSAAMSLAGLAAGLLLLVAAGAALTPWLPPTGRYLWPSHRQLVGLRFQPDPVLGWIPGPGQEARLYEIADGRTISSALYSIDRYGRRITPGQGGVRPRPLLFFGDSYTFGWGVEDDQTFPYYVSRLMPHHRVYNYGVPGYGPQGTLAQLSEEDLRSQIPEREQASAVYFFIDDHVRRAIGSMSWVVSVGPKPLGYDLPYFATGPDGRLAPHGSFRTGRPLRTGLYQALARSVFVRHFDLDWPPIADSDLEFVARMLQQSKASFQTRFGSGRFYVAFFPGSAYAPRLAPMLRAKGVESVVFDPQPFYQALGSATFLPNGHYSPRAYRRLARLIAAELKARGV